MDSIELEVRPLDPLAFRPYGQVLATGSGPGRAINADTSMRFDVSGGLSLNEDGGRPVLAVFSAQAQKAQGPWRVLERHRLGSQTFVPLRGARCIVLVALGGESPDPATLAAFIADGGEGFTLNPGTWHHPLIAPDGGDFVVLERGAQQVDCDVLELARPVSLRLPG